MTHTTLPDQILIQDSRGRVRVPRGRQEVLLTEYEKSGMSGAAFAEHLGIKYQTFATWIQKKKKRATAGLKSPVQRHPVQWVEAVMETSPLQEEKATPLMMRFGVGAVMEITDQKGAMLAAHVLRHLGGERAC